jgi:hypothetical protein
LFARKTAGTEFPTETGPAVRKSPPAHEGLGEHWTGVYSNSPLKNRSQSIERENKNLTIMAWIIEATWHEK